MTEWQLTSAKVETEGAWTVTFKESTFESGAYISKSGMPVLMALGAKLKGLAGGTGEKWGKMVEKQ